MKRAPLLVLQNSKVLKKFFWKFDAISKYQSYFSFYIKDHLWEGESQNCENGYTYSQKLRFCRVNHLLTPWWWKFQSFFVCLFFNSGGQDIYFRSLKGVGSFQVREELRSVCCDFLTWPAEASLCLPQWAVKPFPGDPFWEGTWECWVTSIKDSTDRNMSSQGCFWDSFNVPSTCARINRTCSVPGLRGNQVETCLLCVSTRTVVLISERRHPWNSCQGHMGSEGGVSSEEEETFRGEEEEEEERQS